jgi:hypothetical protein
MVKAGARIGAPRLEGQRFASLPAHRNLVEIVGAGHDWLIMEKAQMSLDKCDQV